jgi:hypothetical protein
VELGERVGGDVPRYWFLFTPSFPRATSYTLAPTSDPPAALSQGYYQEAGRAGRDGAPAHALLFFDAADVARVKRLIGLKGGGGRAKVAAAEAAVDAVAAYARNNTDCRRAQLVRAFGQEGFDSQRECAGTCGACARAGAPAPAPARAPPFALTPRTRLWLAGDGATPLRADGAAAPDGAAGKERKKRAPRGRGGGGGGGGGGWFRRRGGGGGRKAKG